MNNNDQVKKISKAMGIDAQEVALRKEYLQLGEQDVQLLQELNHRLGQTGPEFVDAFYTHLLSFEQTRQLLPNDGIIERLRDAQSQYFSELTQGHYDFEYVLNRLKVGLVHQKVGLEPKWYLGAYNKYISDLIPLICDLFSSDPEKTMGIIRALLKVIFFDMGLALETYFFSNLQETKNARKYAETIISCMPTGMVIFSDDLNVISTNAAFNLMLGLGDLDPAGIKLSELVPTEDIEQRMQQSASDETHHHNIIINIKNGEAVKYFRADLTQVILADEPLCLLLLEDLTQQEHLTSAIKESETKMSAILQNIADGIITIDKSGIVRSFNAAAEHIFGYKATDVIGHNIKMLMPEPYRSEHDEYLKHYLKTGRGKILGIGPREVRGLHRDGTTFPMELATSDVDINNQHIFIGIVRDITQRKKNKEKMLSLSSAVEQTADSVMITDTSGNIIYINAAFEKITGFPKEEVMGRKPNVVKSGKHDKQFYEQLWDNITSGLAFSDVFINRKKDGSLYYEEKTITPILDNVGNILQYVSTGKDITERMEVQEHFHYLAYHDALTELPNRLLLTERLTQALARARWSKRIVALLFLDVDRFKVVNDTLGHDAGDILITEIAKRLIDTVRERDTVARLGGDEYAILLDDLASTEDVSPLADKILKDIEKPFYINKRELFITGSIGISCFPEDGVEHVALLKNADVAMYRAKATGKNNYQFYSKEMSDRAMERLNLETSLRGALDRDEFILFYQPQVDAKTNKIISVEALIRWQHPELGLISPIEFIPMLEETGLILPVGEWVLHKAAEQFSSWNQDGISLQRISVNLSSSQFTAPNLMEVMDRILRESNLKQGQLEIEITESALMHDIQVVIAQLDEMQSKGIRVAIDDFGTGYSSLSYLKKLPLDTLKIDRSFVIDVVNNSDSAAIASAIISMARELNFEVIAEGVETQEQLDFLSRRGCHLIQGYLFSKPLPASQIEKLLMRS